MFYSQTFLARKGPLGTVWCAAHLQHKLKKSHYASTHIPSTVERIICPEVPIALRMSGHLLLGVVRIYSKQVDYLHHDCNVLWVSLRNAFRPVDVNLPENATHAQFNAVTLPETYQLDAVDIDMDLSLDNESQDNHLRSQEEITLKDKHSGQADLYVRITFSDDITPELSRSEASDPMQIDRPTEVSTPVSLGNKNLSPSQRSEGRDERFGEGSSLPDIPAIDDPILRDNPQDVNLFPRMDSDFIPQKSNSPPEMDTQAKDIGTPPLEHILTPVVLLPQSPQRSRSSTPPADAAAFTSDSLERDAHAHSPDLILRSTPPPENPQTTPPENPQAPPPGNPQQRRRRKRQCFDETLVLSNKFLKTALSDPSGLVEKRSKLPSSSLDMHRFINRNKKTSIFVEPLISGMSSDLLNLSTEDSISARPQLRLPESAQLEPRATENPEPVTNVLEEPERLRSPDPDPMQYFRSETMYSPPPSTPQDSTRNAQTSSSTRMPDSISEPRFERTIDSESDRGMYLETPNTGVSEPFEDLNTVLSDIPELRNSADLDELSFLEQDNNSPPDSQRPGDIDPMSIRTSAVAKILERRSSEVLEDLTLNDILKGRSRKLCARMFYETIVLINSKKIDVRQDEPYGDITITLKSTSAAKI